MKKTLTILLIIASTTLSAQSLMLSCRKGTIKAEMRRYPEWVEQHTENGLKYVRGAETVFYGLNDNLCTFASIEMPSTEAERFVLAKLDCNCWCEVGPDQWLYNTQLFDSPVMVKRAVIGDKVRFTYTF